MNVFSFTGMNFTNRSVEESGLQNTLSSTNLCSVISNRFNGDLMAEHLWAMRICSRQG